MGGDKLLYRIKPKYYIKELQEMYESDTSEYIIFEKDDFDKIMQYLDVRELDTIRRSLFSKRGFLKPYKIVKGVK